MAARVLGGEEGHAVYTAESTYGTTPVEATWLWLGIIQEIGPAIDPSLMRMGGCGSRYVQYLKHGLRKVDLSLEYLYQNKNFLDAINQGLPTGSGQPLSIEVYWNDPNGGAIEFGMVHKGCLLNTLDISGRIIAGDDMEVRVRTGIMCQDVAVAATHHSTYPDEYPSDPATVPKLTSDCKIEIGGVEMTDLFDFNFRVRNNLKRYPVIRTSNGKLLKWLLGRQFQVELEVVTYLTTKTYLDGLLADWSGEVKLYVGGELFTISGCSYERIGVPTRLEAETPQRFSFVGKSYALTTP